MQLAKSKKVESEAEDNLDFDEYQQLYTSKVDKNASDIEIRQSYNRYKSTRPTTRNYGDFTILPSDVRGIIFKNQSTKLSRINRTFNRDIHVSNELKKECNRNISGKELKEYIRDIEENQPEDIETNVFSIVNVDDLLSNNDTNIYEYIYDDGLKERYGSFEHHVLHYGTDGCIRILESKEGHKRELEEEENDEDSTEYIPFFLDGKSSDNYGFDFEMMEQLLSKRVNCMNTYENYNKNKTIEIIRENINKLGRDADITYEELINNNVQTGDLPTIIRETKIDIENMFNDYSRDKLENYDYPFDSIYNMKQYRNILIRIFTYLMSLSVFDHYDFFDAYFGLAEESGHSNIFNIPKIGKNISKNTYTKLIDSIGHLYAFVYTGLKLVIIKREEKLLLFENIIPTNFFGNQ